MATINFSKIQMEPNDLKNYLCFFCSCSQDPAINLNEPDNQTNFHLLTFRNLSRYLELFQFDLKGNWPSYSSWFICKQCFQMAEKFNELYHLLEKTKLQLNWYLERMHEVMTAETRNETVNNFRDSVIVRIEETAAPLLPRVFLSKTKNLDGNRLYRHSYCSENEIMLNGSTKRTFESLGLPNSVSSIAHMKIKVEHDHDHEVDLKMEHTHLESPIEETTPALLQQGMRFKTKNLEEEIFRRPSSSLSSNSELYHDEPCEPQELSVLASPVESLKIKTEHFGQGLEQKSVHSKSDNSRGGVVRGKKKYKIRKKKSYIPPPKLHCSFCRAQFDNRHQTAERALHQHVARYHCDQLFPNHKLENVTALDFKKILGKLIWTDLINEDEDTICCFCEKRFSRPSEKANTPEYVSRVKGHFIQAHYEEMEEKLKIFQNNPNLSKMLQEDCDLTYEACECGVYIENGLSRAAHLKWYCPLTCNNGKKKSSPVKGSFNCQYCSYKCVDHLTKLKKRVKYHQVRIHPEHLFPEERDSEQSEWKRKNFKKILTKILFPKFFSRKGNAYIKCSLCETKYQDKRYHRNLCSVKAHLFSNHKDRLKHMLKFLLEESDNSLEQQISRVVKKSLGKEHISSVVSEMDKAIQLLKRKRQHSSDSDI